MLGGGAQSELELMLEQPLEIAGQPGLRREAAQRLAAAQLAALKVAHAQAEADIATAHASLATADARLALARTAQALADATYEAAQRRLERLGSRRRAPHRRRR